jgi:hypothetical protein
MPHHLERSTGSAEADIEVQLKLLLGDNVLLRIDGAVNPLAGGTRVPSVIWLLTESEVKPPGLRDAGRYDTALL